MKQPIIDVDFRQGSLIEKITKTKGVNANNFKVRQKEKGMALECNAESVLPVTHTINANIGTGDFTFVSAFKYNGFLNHGSGWNIFSSYFNSSIFTNGFGFGTSGPNLTFVVNSVSGCALAGTLEIGKVYYCVGVRTGTTLKLYVDNVLADTETIASVAYSIENGTLVSGAESIARTSKADIYFSKVYNYALSDAERAELFNDFQRSGIISKSKTGFKRVKPVDLSREKESGLKEVFTGSLSGDGRGDVTSSGGIYTYTATALAGTAGATFGNPLVAGKKYYVSFYAKSSTGTGTISSIGDNGNADVTLKTQALSSEWQQYIYKISPTQVTCRAYFLSAGLNIGSTIMYKDISIQEISGLVAAYNMRDIGGVIPDISGNGNNAISMTKPAINVSEGLIFNGDKVSSQSYYNTGFYPTKKGTALFRLNFNGTTSNYVLGTKYVDDRFYIERSPTGLRLFLGYGQTLSIVLGNMDETYTVGVDYSGDGQTANMYINGKLFGSGTQLGEVNQQSYPLVIGALMNAGSIVTPFNGELHDFKFYNRVLTAQEQLDYHKSFIVPTLLEDFSDASADGTSIVPKNWMAGTGTYKVGEVTTPDPVLKTITTGAKYLECITAGTIAMPSQQAYGTWEFDWYNSVGSFKLSFISDNINLTNYNGYEIFVSASTQYLALIKRVNGSATFLAQTGGSFISYNTYYRFRITREKNGTFTVLIKGGSFTPTAGYDGWTLVAVSSGTNPVVDNTYTKSSFIVFDSNLGDRIANLNFYNEIK